jgi:hypothetical protein
VRPSCQGLSEVARERRRDLIEVVEVLRAEGGGLAREILEHHCDTVGMVLLARVVQGGVLVVVKLEENGSCASSAERGGKMGPFG